MYGWRSGLIVVPLAAALVAGASGAHAATFTYSSYSVPGEQTIQVLTPNDIYGGMGQIDLVGTGANAGEIIPAWCLDVATYLLGNGYGGSGPFTYDIIVPLTSMVSASGFPVPPGTLSSTQIAEIGGLIAYGDANVNAPNVSAATQLAIWTIEYGNTFSYSGVSSATIAQATWEINELGKIIPLNSNVALLKPVTYEINQALAFVTPLPGALPLFLGGMGVLGFIGSLRKRRPVRFVS